MGVKAFTERYKWLQCSRAGCQGGETFDSDQERGFLSAALAGQGLSFQEESQNKSPVNAVQDGLSSLLPDPCQ